MKIWMTGPGKVDLLNYHTKPLKRWTHAQVINLDLILFYDYP